MKASVALRGISSHLIWPFKEWLILDFFQDLMCWLPEHRVNHLSSSRPKVPSKIPSGPIIVISIRPEISPIMRDNLSFPFPLLLVLFYPFLFINMVYELTHTLTGFLVKDFLKSCSTSRPTLKVFIAMLSKFPSISLNIS